MRTFSSPIYSPWTFSLSGYFPLQTFSPLLNYLIYKTILTSAISFDWLFSAYTYYHRLRKCCTLWRCICFFKITGSHLLGFNSKIVHFMALISSRVKLVVYAPLHGLVFREVPYTPIEFVSFSSLFPCTCSLHKKSCLQPHLFWLLQCSAKAPWRSAAN